MLPNGCRKFREWWRRGPIFPPAACSRRAAPTPRIAAAPPIRPTRSSGLVTGRPAGAPGSSTGDAMAETGTAARPADPVLEVRDLKKHFVIQHGFLRNAAGTVFAVDGVSFSIGAGETIGLV